MRKTPALIATAAVLALGLSGCTAAPELGAPAGAATRAISTSGSFGDAPKVSFPTPLYTETTQRDFAITGPGEGPEITTAAQVMTVRWTLLDGLTGKTVEGATWSDPKPMTVSAWPEGVQNVFLGAHAGDRVVAALAPDDGIGGSGSAVFVADVDSVFPERATGRVVNPTMNGLPSVVTAPDGTPGITLPPSSAPTTSKIATLREGDGEELTAESNVVVQYTAVDWGTRKVLDTTWGTTSPAQIALANPATPAGLTKALVGATVGSQVLAVLTPEDTAGSDKTASPYGDSTVVYVIDVLGTL